MPLPPFPLASARVDVAAINRSAQFAWNPSAAPSGGDKWLRAGPSDSLRPTTGLTLVSAFLMDSEGGDHSNFLTYGAVAAGGYQMMRVTKTLPGGEVLRCMVGNCSWGPNGQYNEVINRSSNYPANPLPVGSWTGGRYWVIPQGQPVVDGRAAGKMYIQRGLAGIDNNDFLGSSIYTPGGDFQYLCIGANTYVQEAGPRPGERLPGRIGLVAGWSRVLTDGEWTWLYNGNAWRTIAEVWALQPSLLTGLMFWHECQQATGTRLDSSGNGNHALEIAQYDPVPNTVPSSTGPTGRTPVTLSIPLATAGLQ